MNPLIQIPDREGFNCRNRENETLKRLADYAARAATNVRAAVPMICFIAGLLVVNPVEAQQQSITIPIKAYIDYKGPIVVTVSVYDQPQAGRLLYITTKRVIAEHGIFADVVEVPSEVVTNNQRVFIEFAKQSSPSLPLAQARMQFSNQRSISPQDTIRVPGDSSCTSVCFTCGGSYPLFAGAIATRIGGQNIERGQLCDGAPNENNNDDRPFICTCN